MAIIRADARSIPLRDGSVQCVVTSPPYWGLRDYGTARWEGGDAKCDHRRFNAYPSGLEGSKESTFNGKFFRETCGLCGARRIDRQIGLEQSPDEYVATMVAVFREVHRVLRDDGTVWLNLGDSYAGGGNYRGTHSEDTLSAKQRSNGGARGVSQLLGAAGKDYGGLKPKDLCGMPWKVAFALQADGWWLRSDIIWAKPNPMPESVTDRPTRSHEYIFLLAKSERYFFDADAIREPHVRLWGSNNGGSMATGYDLKARVGGHERRVAYPLPNEQGRNKRDVWTVNSEPTPEAHFATFPQALITPAILAGTSEKGCCAECGAPWVRKVESTGYHFPEKDAQDVQIQHGVRIRRYKSGADFAKFKAAHPDRFLGWRPSCSHNAPVVPCLVLDPFLGSGTVGKVCERLGRRWAGLDLSEDYIAIARRRTAQRGLFNFGGGNGQAERGHRNPV